MSESLCLWETRPASGFVTKPKFNAELVTVRFVTSGHIVYRRRMGDAVGSPTHATLVGYDDVREVRASNAFSATCGTITVETLLAAHAALTGHAQTGLPDLIPVAEHHLARHDGPVPYDAAGPAPKSGRGSAQRSRLSADPGDHELTVAVGLPEADERDAGESARNLFRRAGRPSKTSPIDA